MTLNNLYDIVNYVSGTHYPKLSKERKVFEKQYNNVGFFFRDLYGGSTITVENYNGFVNFCEHYKKVKEQRELLKSMTDDNQIKQGLDSIQDDYHKWLYLTKLKIWQIKSILMQWMG